MTNEVRPGNSAFLDEVDAILTQTDEEALFGGLGEMLVAICDLDLAYEQQIGPTYTARRHRDWGGKRLVALRYARDMFHVLSRAVNPAVGRALTVEGPRSVHGELVWKPVLQIPGMEWYEFPERLSVYRNYLHGERVRETLQGVAEFLEMIEREHPDLRRV